MTGSTRGSSPRTRGTGAHPPPPIAVPRFIPADAGNRRLLAGSAGSIPVHPRGRGEQLSVIDAGFGFVGSSPRTRGTADGGFKPCSFCRFIPADAGNRAPAHARVNRSAVHPRGRGEQSTWVTVPRSFCGSSPRTRGTDPNTPHRSPGGRFIPADAGNRLLR